MRSTADITYAVTGQTLTLRVMEGLPSSATFSVFPDYADDDATAEFSGSGTVSTVNTTISAASGPSQADVQKLSLTSTSGIATGAKFLLAENSLREWVEPISIHSGYIRVRHPLQHNYTTAATLVGTTITAAIDSTWVADEGNLSDHGDPNPDYRVLWTYVVSGATLYAYTFFDLVRAPIGTQVDIDDVNAYAPELVDTLPVEYRADQGRSLITAAWRGVQAVFASQGIDTDAMRDNQVLDELVIMKALHVLAMGGWKPLGFTLPDYITATREQFDRFLEQHFKVTLKHRMATGTGGGAETQPAPRYFIK